MKKFSVCDKEKGQQTLKQKKRSTPQMYNLIIINELSDQGKKP